MLHVGNIYLHERWKMATWTRGNVGKYSLHGAFGVIIPVLWILWDMGMFRVFRPREVWYVGDVKTRQRERFAPECWKLGKDMEEKTRALLGGRWWISNLLGGRWWISNLLGGRWWISNLLGGRWWISNLLDGRWWISNLLGGRWWISNLLGGRWWISNLLGGRWWISNLLGGRWWISNLLGGRWWISSIIFVFSIFLCPYAWGSDPLWRSFTQGSLQ